MKTYYIHNENDYKAFLDEAVFSDAGNNKKKETIKFRVEFAAVEEFDVELLSLYYLLREKYSDRYYFKLEISMNWDSERSEEIFKLKPYSYFFEYVLNPNADFNTTVQFNDGRVMDLTNAITMDRSFIYARKMMPLMLIDKSIYLFLCQKVNSDIWDSIKDFDYRKVSKTNQNLILGLVNSLLFKKVGTFNARLNELRRELFGHEAFYKLIEGLPLFAVLIFAMFEYAYRDEALAVYKNAIKEETGSETKGLQLYFEDFLYELQNKQLYSRYAAHLKTSEMKYDNKTLWDNREGKVVHPFVVKELFEAVSISEGVLQLLENVVLHADKDKDSNNKIGVISIYMRNKETDSSVLKEKYSRYNDKFITDNSGRKYFFEICITDLSGTSIPKQFEINNADWFSENYDIPSGSIQLQDFFDPDIEKREFWQRFYTDPDHAIKHYGLQIFDSIISSRNGLFVVNSGKETFCNLKFEDNSKFPWGTRYQILCPINEDNYEVGLTNDHLFRFEELKTLPNPIPYAMSDTDLDNDKEIVDVYEGIKSKKWTGGQLLQIDMSRIQNTEWFMKGVLKYIFDISSKPENVNENRMLLLALLNCKAYQMLEIVRIISLYYDKQGNNNKMRYAQIYIKGDKSGEEIWFFGNKLSDVIQNITKSACIRGIMYENIDTINYLLNRENGK